MKGLTKRQSQILGFIQDYIHTHRYSPSYREIMQHFELSSLGSVYKHVTVLRRKGALIGETKGARSLTLAQPAHRQETPQEVEVPFIGHICAGQPIEMFPQYQTIAIPDFLIEAPDNTYVLRAKGDSLQEELIGDGDLLLVEAKNSANPGETVIALINNHDTIVKRIFPEGEFAKLIGHNRHQHPIILRWEDIQIQGVVVGLMRLFRYTTRL